MKISSKKLVDHIKKANVGGVINEVVFDKEMKFAASDDARSVLAICTEPVTKEGFNEIGVYDLDLLCKTVQFSSESIFAVDEELDMVVEENRLVFRKEDSDFKFLLSNPKVISSTIENVDDVLGKLRKEPAVNMVLDNKDIASILKAIALINPEIVTLFIEGGNIYCCVGKDTEHITKIKIGSCPNSGNMKIQFKPDIFSKVLDAVSGCDNVKIELRKEYPIIFVVDGYLFVVAPVKE